ncbi:ATP-dependent DNA helicase Q-like 5 isoform X2 [Amaranthus tricolor]|uniref:ATP-dependent DNA helicase Q-like 5 isoform X2 n=1 Tax=Amaranthus tricolor TaxID=29722 RepID=UPI002586A654|nr:ATP-dependent DNA helicase Q-like 5 isoform X2 [Amaranthus tricolor]
MESDSDSDGSHISATPPRNPTPSPPAKKLPSEPISIVKQKPPFKSLKTNQNPSSNPQKIEPKPSDIPQIKNPIYQSSNSTPLPCFSPPIQRPISNVPDISFPSPLMAKANSCYKSKSGSFLLKKINVNFDDNSEKDPILPSGEALKSEMGVNCEVENVNSGSLKKRVCRKRGNLIGNGLDSESSSISVAPIKRTKCVSEGNFVKLNINGRGKRFKFKGKNRNYSSSSSRRSLYRSKRRLAAKNGVESNGLCDEEGLILENNGKQIKGESTKLRINAGLIKKAVLDVRNDASDENLVNLLRLTHGYDSFRDGQLEAIKMVLGGNSTMLVLPTGAGKSLCYQLPAIIFPGITLVVSPLMALMIDQLKQLPSVVNGALLSSSQSLEEMSETLTLLQEGSIKVLFVSPERFLNEEFMSIISSCPLISLVVIDEAHCVSEWSHNFRPSYMRLRASVLHDKLKAGCVLAMTATATQKALHAVMHALDIPSMNLVQTHHLRNNLQLSVSMSGNKKVKDLIAIMKSSPYSELKSIIIYCKFQSETDMISKCLNDSNIPAMSYHSGMMAKDRSRVQALFCSNKIRVVVATVAFGMGLDKSDVGAVIHYSLPESLEEYVQEIGRAGRDGRLSYCHMFFDDTSYFRLRSLMYSDGVDEYAVNKLLGEVFNHDTGKIHSLIKESVSRKYDIKEEVILTILTQLELGEVQYLHLHPQMNVTCSLNFHKTPPMDLAARDHLVAGILNKAETKHGLHVFDIPTVANEIGYTVKQFINQLQNLKSIGEITYELKDPGYCFTVVHVPRDLCSLATQMTKWLSEIECCKIRKLDMMFNAATLAVKSCESMNECDVSQKYQHTASLQKIISEYFSEETLIDPPTKIKQNSPFLRADIKVFLQNNSAAKLTPRAVARVMHGIASPAYPSAAWSKTHFWGRYTDVDFKAIMEAAKLELMNFVGKDKP